MRNKTILLSRIWFIALMCALCALFFASPYVAYAELPPAYVDSVQSAGLEWWSDLLALGEVKEKVDAWFSPSNKMYDFSTLDDDPVVIAVIDSGVDVDHELFTGDYGAPTSDGTGLFDVFYRNSRGVIKGANTVSGTDLSDVSEGGHGTHVAGIVATLIHWLGLEKYIKIMPIMAGKPSGSGASFEAVDVKEGIEYALANGADVVNLSLESTSTEFRFVSDEWASRAIFVAAAGNGRTVGSSKLGYDSAQQKCYPAAAEQVIGVMNISNELDVNGDLQLSSSSNYGDAYDLCAPGANIYSAQNKAGDYISKSGTSMATPVVSFASALALLKFRAIEAATNIGRSVDDVRELVKFSSTKQINKGKYSLGVIDLEKLVSSDDSVLARIDFDDGDVQTLGDIRPVSATLKVLPEELAGQGRVEWKIGSADGETLGEGFAFDFTPQNSHGKQNVYAVWTVDTDSGEKTIVAMRAFTVDYARFTADTLKTLKIGVLDQNGAVLTRVRYQKGKTYEITFEGVNNYDPDVVEDCQWLVNGEIVDIGASFLFMPASADKYYISMRLGTRNTDVATISFTKYNSVSRDELISYITYAATAVILLIAIALLLAILIKRRHLRR